MFALRRDVLLKFSPKPQKRLAIAAGIIVLALLSAGGLRLEAQEKNPYAGDAKVAKLGEYQFRSNCAFCHGLGARGGARGPDLTRAQKHHGNTDGELFHNIHDGIAGTAMPAATNGGIGVGMSNEDSFTVQMPDTREQLHAFEKVKLRSYVKTRESLMPAYDEKTLPEKDLKDLIAFLLAASEKGGGQ